MRSRIESLIAGLVGAIFSAVLLGPLVRSVDASYVPVPTGTIAHFNATTCPAGWTEFTNARGVTLVGRVASGTLNTVVGTPLTDLENRPTGVHSHTATASVSLNDPGHTHNGRTSASPAAGYSVPNVGTPFKAADSTNGSGGDNATTSNTTGITVSSATATVNNSSGVAGTNAPYIELLVCSKS